MLILRLDGDLLQVLEGVDPITEELGPYVYSATHVRRIIEVTLTLGCQLLLHPVSFISDG